MADSTRALEGVWQDSPRVVKGETSEPSGSVFSSLSRAGTGNVQTFCSSCKSSPHKPQPRQVLQHGSVIKIDLRVPGVPQKAVFEDEDRTKRIRRLAHTLKNQSEEKALIKDMQKTDTFNPFSEGSNKIIHNLGNVEYFDLCEVSAKAQ